VPIEPVGAGKIVILDDCVDNLGDKWGCMGIISSFAVDKYNRILTADLQMGFAP
jgi:hypothetical protein